MTIRAATLSRIEEAHRFSAFYEDYLANHLPMALVALDAMGATDGEIERFAVAYAARLEPLAAARAEIAEGGEDAFLGDASAFPAWVDYFRRALAVDEPRVVVATWTRRLAPGIGTALFHGAIRTAYALESGSRAELAHALAYWAAALEKLPSDAAPAGKLSARAALAAIHGDPEYAGKRLARRGTAGRIAAVVSRPSFAAHVAALDPAELDLDRIAAALIRAYAASGDFTLLHGVTGCHAYRALASATGLAPEAHFWRWLVAAYASCGSPPTEGWGLAGDDRLGWNEIHDRVRGCDDEHDVKLVYSCWREWQRAGDDIYRRAASARVSNARSAFHAPRAAAGIG